MPVRFHALLLLNQFLKLVRGFSIAMDPADDFLGVFYEVFQVGMVRKQIRVVARVKPIVQVERGHVRLR